MNNNVKAGCTFGYFQIPVFSTLGVSKHKPVNNLGSIGHETIKIELCACFQMPEKGVMLEDDALMTQKHVFINDTFSMYGI